MSADLQDKYKKIYRYCYLRVKNRETAEDITQETFLRFIEHPEYKGLDKDLQLLYTIAGNLCLDHFRSQSPDELPEDIPDRNADGDKLVDDISLHDALNKLPAEDRELILLRYINNEPLSVISAIYGISRFALSRKLKRILSALRNELGKEGTV